MARSNKTTYYYIVEPGSERESTVDTSTIYEFIRMAVIRSGGNSVLEMSCPRHLKKHSEQILSMPKGRYFAVQGLQDKATGGSSSTSDEYIHLTENCKIFVKSKKFDLPDGVVEAYEKPAVVDLGEIRRSPVKRRLSIKATVQSVSGVRGAEKKRVKEVKMGDGQESVSVYLWGEKSEAHFYCGEEVTIGPLMVAMDKRTKLKRLNSVDTTSVQHGRFWTCVVDGTSEDGVFPMDLLLDGGSVITLDRDFGIDFGELPKAIVIERAEDEIISVQVLGDGGEEDDN